MKTRKQQLEEMLLALQNDNLRLTIIRDFKQFLFDNDEELKGNLEAKKEIDATNFSLKTNEKMTLWIEKELE